MGCGEQVFSQRENRKLQKNSKRQNGYVDTVAREELEAEKDRIRLQKELDAELQQAFGDGDFSDAENTSSYYATGNNPNSHSKNSPNDVHRHDNDRSELERMKVLYDVRIRENEQLREEIKRLKNEADFERGRVTDLLKQVQKYAESEELKQTALHELELCKATIREQEKRLIVAEKNTYKSEEANFDCVLKELTLNHKQEVNSMQKTIDNITNKLNFSERNCIRLEQQLQDEKQAHSEQRNVLKNEIESLKRETTVVKSENEMLKLQAAEVTQKQCENETLKLQLARVKQTQSENETLRLQLAKAKEDQDVLRRTLMDHVTKSETLHKDGLKNALKELTSKHESEVEALKKEIMSLKMENERLKLHLTNVKEEEDALRKSLMDHVTKADVQRQEELSELELTYSKRILELEAQLQEVENSTKENMFKMYLEETDRISTTFIDHFDVLNDTVGKLKHELETQMKELALKNESIEKLRSELEKVYEKYVNLRKSAIALKQQLYNQTQLLQRRNQEFCETMKKINKCIDQADTKKLNEVVQNSLMAQKNVNGDDFSHNGFLTDI